MLSRQLKLISMLLLLWLYAILRQQKKVKNIFLYFSLSVQFASGRLTAFAGGARPPSHPFRRLFSRGGFGASYPPPREPKSPSANFSSAIGRIAEYLLNRSSNIDFPLSPSFCEISPSRHQCAALYVHHSANGVFKFHSSMQFCVISLSRSIGRFSTFESDKASSGQNNTINCRVVLQSIFMPV